MRKPDYRRRLNSLVRQPPRGTGRLRRGMERALPATSSGGSGQPLGLVATGVVTVTVTVDEAGTLVSMASPFGTVNGASDALGIAVLVSPADDTLRDFSVVVTSYGQSAVLSLQAGGTESVTFTQ